MKQIDKLWDGKIKPGFEMLVNNFSAGIAAAAPRRRRLLQLRAGHREGRRQGLGNGGRLAGRQQPAAAGQPHHRAGQGALPQQRHQPRRAHPARGPAGGRARLVDPVPARGQPRPRPGRPARLHVLRDRAWPGAPPPGAAIIHFFGGIHEIYFPYVLMKPILLLGTISGGMVGIGTLAVFDAGLRAPAAPGSIIAVLAQTPGRQLRRRHPVGRARRRDVLPHLLGAAQAEPQARAATSRRRRPRWRR